MGFITANTENTNYNITNPCSVLNLDAPNYKNTKIACFGDSITYGAWSAIEYPRLLCEMLRYSKNIGDITYDNYAVSGQQSSQQLAIMQTIDLTPYKYITIMVGTNDLQGGTSVATFISNVTQMVNLCLAAGSIPIIGLFPIFTTKSIIGTGKDTTNYEKSPIYISELEKYCIANNIKIANVRFSFSDNLQWYFDGIHPNERGHISIARAFYKAIMQIILLNL
jgi:lysophospholipase L1-like esterase